MQNERFGAYHPLVNFMYFVCVIGLAMVVTVPAAQLVSLACAFAYSVLLNGKRAAFFGLFGMLPLIVLTALLNPLFNHQGATILFYLKSGNPVTAESVAFGVVSGLMFAAVIVWFSCYNAVISSDKIIYLFGKAIPGFSLLFSMSLRLVPRLKWQFRRIWEGQQALGQVRNQSFFGKLKGGVRLFSMLTTWALENTVETADSMKARGYGFAGRTAFSLFRWERRDGLLLAVVLLSAGTIIAGLFSGTFAMQFFPVLRPPSDGVWYRLALLAYCLLCAAPIIINLWEGYRWNLLQSNS